MIKEVAQQLNDINNKLHVLLWEELSRSDLIAIERELSKSIAIIHKKMLTAESFFHKEFIDSGVTTDELNNENI